MKKYFKYCLFVVIVLLSTFTISSCSDWTDVEELDLNNPLIKDLNAKLYADYLKNLREYKSKEHNVVLVSFENTDHPPVKQGERLTTIPDSIDIICLNNPKDLNAIIQKEIEQIREEKGTKTVYNISYDEFESTWKEMIKENPKLTENDALKFIEEQTEAMLSLCDKYNYDGIIADYTGRSLVSLRPQELAMYNARQQSFFNKIISWKSSNEAKIAVFYGNAQYLVPENMGMMNSYDYIILKSALSTNGEDLSLKAYLALQAGIDSQEGESEIANPIPNDRFIGCVQLPQADDKNQVIGYWNTRVNGEKTIAAYGASEWVVEESPNFVRSGIFMLNIHSDYYQKDTYKIVRDAINIMNPNK